jgi:hypothetical protein
MVVETGIRSIDQPVLDGLWTITLGSSTRFHSRKHHQALLVPDPVPVSQPQPPGGNRHTQPKCNAHVGEGTITPAVSIDNFVTFFLFLTFDYISLHQNTPGPSKFRNNRRFSRTGARGAADSHEKLAIFGRWKEGTPTFQVNSRRYNNNVIPYPVKPFISFHIISPKQPPKPAAMGASEPCTLTTIDTALMHPLFSGGLHFIAQKAAATRVFCEKSRLPRLKLSSDPEMNTKNGEKRGVRTAKTSWNQGGVARRLQRLAKHVRSSAFRRGFAT